MAQVPLDWCEQLADAALGRGRRGQWVKPATKQDDNKPEVFVLFNHCWLRTVPCGHHYNPIFYTLGSGSLLQAIPVLQFYSTNPFGFTSWFKAPRSFCWMVLFLNLMWTKSNWCWSGSDRFVVDVLAQVWSPDFGPVDSWLVFLNCSSDRPGLVDICSNWTHNWFLSALTNSLLNEEVN